MKNQILDSPFRDSFSDYIVNGETIIWEGQPIAINDLGDDDLTDDFENHRFITILILAGIIFIYWANMPYLILIAFIAVSFFAIISPKWNRKNKRNFSYAITQNQILFRMKEKWKSNYIVYSIPFSKIKQIIIVMAFDVEKRKTEYDEVYIATPTFYAKEGIEKIGTIFIVPHQPKSINFETTNLTNRENRHLPTLELLDDVNEVAKIIRESIKNSKSLQ